MSLAADKQQRFQPIILKTLDIHWFEHCANWPQKFETCPMWGAKLKPLVNKHPRRSCRMFPPIDLPLQAAILVDGIPCT